MQKRVLFFVLAILCLLIAGWAYYLYQKPRAGVTGTKADFAISAPALYKEFTMNEEAATKKYVDKVLQVTGKVQQIDSMQGNVNVILYADVADGGVNCTFAGNENIPKAGEEVVIKGRCTGFLMDVSLVDAELEKK